MGYNFWFKLVINKENKEEFINYMNNNGILNDTGYIAKVEFDTLTLDYINRYYPDDEIQKQLEIDKRAKIGYIFFKEHIKATHPDKVAFSFMAATQYLSSLFRDSESVYKWFIELSNVTNSLLTYIDFEHFGYRVIFHKGKEVNIEIKYDDQEQDYSNIPNFNEIIEYFHNFAQIYFLGQ